MRCRRPPLKDAPRRSTLTSDRLSAPRPPAGQRDGPKTIAVTPSGPPGYVGGSPREAERPMSFKRWQGPIRPVSNGHTVNRLRLAADLDAPAAARDAIRELHDLVS